jgi:hypothetical protein
MERIIDMHGPILKYLVNELKQHKMVHRYAAACISMYFNKYHAQYKL